MRVARSPFLSLFTLVAVSGCVLEVPAEAPPPEAPTRVSARELQVTDERGELRAAVATQEGKSLLGLSHPAHEGGLLMGVDAQHASLQLTDQRGETAITLGVGFQLEEGWSPGILSSFDSSGAHRLVLLLDAKGRAGLHLLDEAQRPRLVLEEDGLAFLDAAGRPRLRLGLGDDGTPRVTALDAEGKETQLVPR